MQPKPPKKRANHDLEHKYMHQEHHITKKNQNQITPTQNSTPIAVTVNPALPYSGRSLLSSTGSWGIPGIPGIFGILKNEIWLGNHLKSHSHSCGMGMNSHEIIPRILGTE